MRQTFTTLFAALLIFSAAGCSGGPMTTREKGAGIGALGGAAAGGIIGAAVGHPGAGAAIGGALGLGTGALVGDQMQGQDQRQSDQQRIANDESSIGLKSKASIKQYSLKDTDERGDFFTSSRLSCWSHR